ncbi:hypothetical protein F9288_17315 [Sphingomonas sp. CL5.1]|uniref:hypothetical protein n=1 Tax=Sphingomonas sp. CL5.1 TaxID=2653203 RepID=UPI001583D064|nr:hypothetical protein [Sphingomonas sp. CL5.1]QKS01190.1 hypothetical protein F9288_17315 [Sphingomonas sp. CL5.1]
MLLLPLGGCSPTSPPGQGMRAYELSLAVSPAESFTAWHGGTGAGSAIFVQRVGGHAQLTGAPMRVSDGKRLAYEPDLILAGRRLVLAWYEKDPASGALSARLAAMDPRGRLLWRVRLGTAGAVSRNPVVRVIGGAIHVAWIEQAGPPGPDNRAGVWYQVFSPDGGAVAPARMIGEANRDTWNLNAATAGHSFIITYDAALGTKAHELRMLVVTGDTVRRVRLSTDDGKASLYPDLQLSRDGTAALTWFDEKDGNREVYLQVAPLDALGAANGPKPVRITHDRGESIGAYLAWNGSTLGLAWSDDPYGRREVFAELFDETGRALGAPRQLGNSEGRASTPAIRASGAGFLIAWNDYVATGSGAHETVRTSRARLEWIPVIRRSVAPSGSGRPQMAAFRASGAHGR